MLPASEETMPIYEYECRGCRKQFELLVLPGTDPACPACQGSDLEKLLSIASVSSDGTRQRNLGVARQAAKKIQRDKAHAEHEAYHHHHH
jgi:putative FmdB family regulatory protein